MYLSVTQPVALSLWGGVKTGMLTIGFNRKHINGNPSTLNIKGKLVINGIGHHSIGAGCCIEVCKNSKLEIGNKFALAGNSTITVNHHIVIGDNNLWSYNNVVMDYDSHAIFDRQSNEKINKAQEVVFGDNVWMGCGCTVLKGSRIPNGTVIAARSMISKKLFGENCIISTQGKVLRENVIWKG